MVGTLDRRVWRIQRRLRSREPADAPIRLPMSDLKELEARVRRLHQLGTAHKHVRLSSYLVTSGTHGARIRVRGECVATDV